MRLYLVPNPRNTIGTVDEVDNASYANDQGYFMYHVETPRRKYRFPLAGPSQVTTIYRSNVAARILGSCPTLSARESQTTTPARSWPRRRRRNSDLRDDDEDSLDWDFAPPPTYQDAILSPQTTGELLLGASALSLEYPDRGEKFAEIEFNTYSPTHFRYGERDCVEHDLFEEGSMSFWNYSKRYVVREAIYEAGPLKTCIKSRNRVFRATDENTYVWVNSENRQTRVSNIGSFCCPKIC